MLDLSQWTDNEAEIAVLNARRLPGVTDEQVAECLHVWLTQRQTRFWLRIPAGKSRSRLYWALMADTMLEVLRPATPQEQKDLQHAPYKAKEHPGQGNLF